MKKFLLLIILIVLAGFAYLYFVEGKRSMKEMRREIDKVMDRTGVQEIIGPEPTAVKKCITPSGEVIYGEIPEGIECAQVGDVEGSLTVVPSEVIMSVNDPVRGNPDQVVEQLPKITTGTRQAAPKKLLTCETVQPCSQFTSCEQVTLFAHDCAEWNIYDANRVECMKRWCEKD